MIERAAVCIRAHRVLGGAVRGQIGYWGKSRHAGYVDYMATFASQEPREHRTHVLQDAYEVHLDRQAILVCGELIAGPWQAYPRVVDQDVDRSSL